MYQIEFAGRAQRAFRNLSVDIQRRLDPAILALANNPRPPGCTKLAGEESLWRLQTL
jgi:mRNA interferase RelE/StbE